MLLVLLCFILNVLADPSTPIEASECLPEDQYYDKYSQSHCFGNRSCKLPTDNTLGDLNYLTCISFIASDNELKINNSVVVTENGWLKNVNDWILMLQKNMFYQMGQGNNKIHDDACGTKLRKLKRALTQLTNDDISSTCPRFLLYDKICLGLMADDGCNHVNTDCSMCPGYMLPGLCKNDVDNFFKSCFRTNEGMRVLLSESLAGLLHDKALCGECKPVNLIYQGLTSLRELGSDGKGRITVSCDDGQAKFVCYKDGLPVENARWYTNQTHDVSMKGGMISMGNIDNYTDITCTSGSDDSHIAIIVSSAVHHACHIRESEVYEDEDELPTDLYTPETPLYKIYENNDFTRPVSFKRLQAFNNKARVLSGVGLLSIGEIVIYGTYTPICGDSGAWDHNAAAVFCRGIGKQIGEILQPTFRGIMPKKENPGHGSSEWYMHYLTGLNCTGNETDLIWCDHDGWTYARECDYDAVVICDRVKKDPSKIVIYTVLPIMISIIILGMVLVICKRDKILNMVNRLIVKHGHPTHQKINVANYNGNGRTSQETTESTGILIGSAPNGVYVYNQTVSTAPNGVFQSTVLGSDLQSVEFRTEYGSQMETVEEKPTITANTLHGFRWSSTGKALVCLCDITVSGGGQESRTEKVVCKYCETIVGESQDHILSEFKFLYFTSHPNIVQLRYFGQPDSDPFYISSLGWVFAMEYSENGNLSDFLKNNGHSLDVTSAESLIMGICSGLAHVHDKGYVHGDLSIDNILVFVDKESKTISAKLTDFGSFYKVKKSEPRSLDSMRYTAKYAAPEMYHEPLVSDPMKSEVWALGLILWDVTSWIVCPRNSVPRNPEKGDSTCNSDSGIYSMSDRTMPASAFITQEYREMGCRRSLHESLMEQLNSHFKLVATEDKLSRPDFVVMNDFYHHEGKPVIRKPVRHEQADRIFGWGINSLIDGCLRDKTNDRYSMTDVMTALSHRLLPKSDTVQPLDLNNGGQPLDLNNGQDPHVTVIDADAKKVKQKKHCSVM